MEPILALYSLTALVGLWVILFWLYPDYRVDAFREDMFALRDELFEYAAGGGIQFDDPLYVLLRNTMNGFIRVGHKLSLGHLVVFLWWTNGAKSYRPKFAEIWESRIKHVSCQQRESLVGIRDRMNVLVTKHMVFNSPLFALMFAPVVLAKGLLAFTKKLQSLLRIESIDTLASVAGR